MRQVGCFGDADVGYAGYAASVAPSDSISSVGIKRERESRLRGAHEW